MPYHVWNHYPQWLNFILIRFVTNNVFMKLFIRNYLVRQLFLRKFKKAHYYIYAFYILFFGLFLLQKDFCIYFVLVLVTFLCYFHNILLILLYNFLTNNNFVNILLTFLYLAHDDCFYFSLFKWEIGFFCVKKTHFFAQICTF